MPFRVSRRPCRCALVFWALAPLTPDPPVLCGAQLLRSLEAFQRAVLMCDMGSRGWRILYANEAWSKATGVLPFPPRHLPAHHGDIWSTHSCVQHSSARGPACLA